MNISRSFTPFPVIRYGKAAAPWNIHLLRLDNLPEISVVQPELIRWLGVHLRYAHSDQERKKIDQQAAVRPLAQVKHSLYTMFTTFAGYKGTAQRRVFALTTSEGDADCLIFVTGIRSDLASHTVVADAFALPLTSTLRDQLSDAVQVLQPSICQLDLGDDALALWRSLLPALAERCRDWDHTDECASMSSRIAQNPSSLCGCGQGKVTDAFRSTKDWAPLAEHVTRIAISPLFAVSFLEDVGKDYGEASRDHGLSDETVRKMMRTGSAGSLSLQGEASGVRCKACAKSLPEGKRMMCSRCKKVVYCSRECQASDWKTHKRGCTV